MAAAGRTVAEIRHDIKRREAEVAQLRAELHQAQTQEQSRVPRSNGHGPEADELQWKWPMREEEYERYARQLVVPDFGIEAQLNLREASVLIVGAGGLGCPAALYLAGAGIGTIGVVDGDVVEVSNLHRQIAHTLDRVGMFKADSVIASMKAINPLLEYRSHTENLTPSNAESIVSHYDLVLDCTDHPSSRYLISDICVLLEKPLVSASALRTDGQLIVLNCPPSPQGSQYQYAGPCYRCIYPKPPPPESVLSCGEGGILGPVVGVMGVLQALEAIRIIAHGLHRGIDRAPLPSAVGGEKLTPTLTLFSTSTDGAPSFRNVRMRRRRKDCFACSAASTLTLESLKNGSIDYVQFCGVATGPSPLRPEERISALEYSQIQRQVNGAAAADHVLLDVRQREHFDVANIPGAINVPFSTFQQQMRQRTTIGTAGDDQIDFLNPADTRPVFVVCRVGNDSQSVVRQLKDAAAAEGHAERRPFVDISGGMKAWKRDVDPTMPFV